MASPRGRRTRCRDLGAGLPVAPAGLPARASGRVRRRDGPLFQGTVPRGAGGRRRPGSGSAVGPHPTGVALHRAQGEEQYVGQERVPIRRRRCARAAFILLIPLLAAPVWSLADFVIAGALIFGTGLRYKLVAGKAGNIAYRIALGAALAAALLLVWLSLGVGIIGAYGDPANSMYFGVVGVGIIGAIVARFRPHGMARALFATALAQALVAVIALIFGLGFPWSPPVEILILNGFFVALFVGSALLFRHAGRERTPAGAGPEG